MFLPHNGSRNIFRNNRMKREVQYMHQPYIKITCHKIFHDLMLKKKHFPILGKVSSCKYLLYKWMCYVITGFNIFSSSEWSMLEEALCFDEARRRRSTKFSVHVFGTSCLQGIFSQPFLIHLKYKPAHFSCLRFTNPTKSIQDYISVYSLAFLRSNSDVWNTRSCGNCVWWNMFRQEIRNCCLLRHLTSWLTVVNI